MPARISIVRKAGCRDLFLAPVAASTRGRVPTGPAQQTTFVPDHLLLMDRLGRSVQGSTNAASRALQPQVIAGLGQQIPTGSKGAAMAVRAFGLLALLRINLSVKDWIGKSTHVVASLYWVAGNRLIRMNAGGGESL